LRNSRRFPFRSKTFFDILEFALKFQLQGGGGGEEEL
jgi:hypothetical protein